MFSYKEFVSRNWGYLKGAEQIKLGKVRVLFAGCGLGSVVAELSTRTGFKNFILVDGDTVELSNLNRQAFSREYLGMNKAEATAKIVKSINSNMHIEVYPEFITEEKIGFYVSRADFIVNTVDLSSPVFLLLNRVVREQGKSVLFPLNLGWGGALIVFTSNSATLEKMIGIEDNTELDDLFSKLILTIASRISVPSYLRKMLKRFKNRTAKTWPCDPQLGVAAYLTASLVVSGLVRLTLGLPVKVAPEINAIDLWSSIEP